MKYIIRKITFLIVLMFLSISINAQSKIDSLKKLLKNKPVKDKIEIYCQISNMYLDMSLPDTALKYANIGISLIDKNNEPNKKTDYILTIGSCYVRLSKYKLALTYLQQAYDDYKVKNNKKKLIITLDEFGIVYGQTMNFDKALSYFQQSLSISYEIKDTSSTCSALCNIGMIYQQTTNYKQALYNFEKGLDLATKINNSEKIAIALTDISNIYFNLKDFKSSLTYSSRALDIFKKLDNKEGIVYAMSNIGDIYDALKNYSMSLKYYESVFKISNEFDDMFIRSQILCGIGNNYINLKNYDKAKQFLDKAESLAVKIDNSKTVRDVYESFSLYYSKKNDYKKALDYYKRFKDLNDSIYSKASSDKIAELQIKFEIDEKDKENEILLQKTEIQQLAINKQIYLRNTFIYISVIITLLVLIIFYRYWIKQRANKILTQKNEFINIQKNELQEAFNTKDKLFSIITHDLKNPFSTLVSLCKFLISNYNTLDEEHKCSALLSLNSSILNVNELLINLTDWLNSTANNLVLNKTNFNLNTTIYSILELYKIEAEQKSIDLQMHIITTIYASGDERMIKTVLRNLVDNALKFTPVNGKIDIDAKVDNDKITVSVKDTGTGIKELDKNELFNLRTVSPTEGTQYKKEGGLGLILSKEFIEKNNGKIWFESEIGKGSTFYFTLIKGGFYD